MKTTTVSCNKCKKTVGILAAGSDWTTGTIATCGTCVDKAKKAAAKKGTTRKSSG